MKTCLIQFMYGLLLYGEHPPFCVVIASLAHVPIVIICRHKLASHFKWLYIFKRAELPSLKDTHVLFMLLQAVVSWSTYI